MDSTFDPVFKNDLEQSESCRARQDLPVRAVRASFTLSMLNEKFIDNLADKKQRNSETTATPHEAVDETSEPQCP